MDLNTVSLIGTAIKLAWAAYDKGFKKEKSSPQRYIEFGSALHGLHGNLKTIESIVTKASNDLRSEEVGPFGPGAYDLRPLAEIIGNFKLTLDDCRDLLNDESKFRQKNGVITNIIYNIDVDPYVIQLTERIAFHNNKIGFILEPFKLHLQSELRSLQKQQHQDVSERIEELKQLLVTNLDIKDGVPTQISRDLEVPQELSERFIIACGPCGQAGEADRILPEFPLKDGLEAFFYHFNGISQALDSMSYLRLIKSVWIMDRIRESDDWAKIQRTNPGGLYDRCVREMDRRLRAECSRVTVSQIPLPELLLQLPDETFSIWPPENTNNQSASVNHLGVLLDIPILPEPRSHTLRVVRNIDGTLGIEDTTITTAESTGTLSSKERVQTVNIDPRSAYFVPIYATPVEPGDNPPALMVKLQSSRDGVNGVVPVFESSTDLMRLQHLITGYKCVKQRNHVNITSLSEGQEFPAYTNNGKKSKKTAKEIYEYGNIQMWQRSPYENKSATDVNKDDAGRRLSVLSSPTAIRSVESSMSFTTIGTMSSAHTQQVTVGRSGGTGIQLKQPEPPILVLFLKEMNHGLLSFLVVELDEFTHINPFSCKCGSPKKKCTISVLERSKKPLLARRFYAKEGLNSWNLAALGEHWPPHDNGSVIVQNMYWLRLDFKQESERFRFSNNIQSLIAMFAGRMDDYRNDLRNIRQHHIISKR